MLSVLHVHHQLDGMHQRYEESSSVKSKDLEPVHPADDSWQRKSEPSLLTTRVAVFSKKQIWYLSILLMILGRENLHAKQGTENL